MQNRKIMLFDLSIGGHHPTYIRYLIQYWHQEQRPEQLSIVVIPKFLTEHADVVELAKFYDSKKINFVAISSEEESLINSRETRIQRAFRNFREWKILCKYATQLNVDHCLILYFDTCQQPLTLGLSSPCRFSGIYFRPTLHYSQLKNAQDRDHNKSSNWLEKLTVSRVLGHPKLQTLFCLDPIAVKYLNHQFKTAAKVIHLPDPVEPFPPSSLSSSEIREHLGIQPNRKVFLLFGALTERKGVHQLLEAISQLPAQLCEQICLLLVGNLTSRIETQFKSQIQAVCQAKPVQILGNYEYIPDSAIPNYFQVADVILAPYQRHVGMSGILLLAAAAEKPLLSSDYGLMGELVQRYELGLIVDSTQPGEIAKGLTQLMQSSLQSFCNPKKMKQFVQENSAQKFSEIIFNSI
ncbi:glycosyltransferase family 4 protein [Limnoraphis robusta Tam1]|uniref:Glycosyltransferase family 4 protein n=1 Tax=Limnoraphis robusta CCNP1315 TaxID=3110306 RepID=A0ABU5TXM2_9CYAN|nr:glycosyltransferase family 4 protein [Limnoraphis robusta]MEA5497273.1 glycosyltransferase family 4 protein [Limnoraphis robusta BA-68 BA1]MEA5519691.1 glycosyltransferase family 4 protein [Limnoraphis robusta CCNP1315]MEA5540158.1 glycosyltransferase family 4 protein [Limnoraphis robusta Tam1]MEA5544815.1 glycosyltransferase family 4 protein [Limnoraphis robusta CCNP1324]